jgi:hypothetical protein
VNQKEGLDGCLEDEHCMRIAGLGQHVQTLAQRLPEVVQVKLTAERIENERVAGE